MATRTSRRHFLHRASLSTGALVLSRSLLAESSGTQHATLEVRADQSGILVPADFIGLSYENMQLEDATFFSPANKSLIEQFRAIAPRGVLRLGGNTSEFGWWKTSASDPEPKRVDSPWKAAGEPTHATVFAITPEAIDNLNGFLVSTGWTCIYGLNLGYGTPETDVAEARYVFEKLGPRLQYFQIGNEVDLFKGHLRDPATWNVDRYLEQWLVIAHAVEKALPGAKFGMPDVAADVSWLSQIAGRWSAVTDKPNVVTLSHHYYWDGPPANPQANIANLLKVDPKVARFGKMSRDAAERIGRGVTWRMTEGNTVYRGGKYGVSDVFAAALWGAEYLLELMSLGYCGVNLHGGSGHAQAVSVGGVFHGESLMPDPNLPHPKPFYTPIANEGTLAGAGVEGKLNGTYLLEPVGFGMKFAAALPGCSMLPVNFDPGSVQASAFGARQADGKVLAVILNKDASQPLAVALPACRVLSQLSAPALESREAHVTSGSGPRIAAGALVVGPHSAVLVELL